MKQLLNSKNLLAEKRVVAAYKALVNRSPGYCSHQPASSYCDVCGVPGSLADVAFEMRDAMVTEDLMWHWNLNINDLCSDVVEIDDRHMHSLRYATPKQWIIAAVKAGSKSNETL